MRMGRMATVGRGMVDQGGTFESELSPEEEGVAKFEEADCARTERSVEALAGAEECAAEGKRVCGGMRQQRKEADRRMEKQRKPKAATTTTRWDQGGGGGNSWEKVRGQKRGDRCGGWDGTADGVEPCFHPQRRPGIF